MQKRSRSRFTQGVVALTVAIPAGVSVFVARYGTQAAAFNGQKPGDPMVDGARAGGLALLATFVGVFALLEVVMMVLRRRKGAEDSESPAED